MRVYLVPFLFLITDIIGFRARVFPTSEFRPVGTCLAVHGFAVSGVNLAVSLLFSSV